MLAHLKRFGRIDHKCDHDHWPGSSACSSHLPRPGLLQRVSQVIIRPTDLKRSNSPHSCDWDYFFCLPFCNILPRCNNSCTLQGENKQSLWEGCQWLPITPWGPKEWCWCYFPSAALIEKGLLTHTINSKLISKISRVTRKPSCQTWIL